MPLNYIQANERLVGAGHAAYADTLNRPLKDLITQSGDDANAPSGYVPAGPAALPGNGRTTPTVSAYLDNNKVFNVLDYVDPAITDMGVVANACIAASTPGSVVRFPAGKFEVASPIIYKSGRTYEGDSQDDYLNSYWYLKAGSSVTALFVPEVWETNQTGTGRPVTIRNVVFDGNKANGATGMGIILMNWRSKIENVHIFNFSSHGIYLPSKTKNGTTITSTSVEDRIVDCKIGNCDGHGIYSDDAATKVTDGFITDTLIHNTGGDGINIAHASGWRISGNHLYSIGGHGIRMDACWSTTVTDNYIEGFGLTGTNGTTYYGIRGHLIGNRGSTIALNRVFNTQSAAGVTYYCYFLQPGSSTAAEIVFQGNLARGNGADTAIYCAASSGGTLAGILANNYVVNAAIPFDSQGTAHIASLRAEGNSWQYGTAAPTAGSGTWIAGWKVWHTAPAATYNVGWVCTASGTPGTWAQFGRVASDVGIATMERGWQVTGTIPANQNNAPLTDPLSLWGRTQNRAGSITAMGVRLKNARTAGFFKVKAQKSGDGGATWSTIAGCEVVMNGASQGTRIPFARDLYTFAATERLRLVADTDSAWAPTTNDAEAWIEVTN